MQSARSLLGTDLLWLATAAALLVGATGVIAGTDVRSDAQVAVINSGCPGDGLPTGFVWHATGTRPVAAVTVPDPSRTPSTVNAMAPAHRRFAHV